tara:strand:- start:404 stop:736 length:333 start_codon:yes stop_codon:yes gene_type:complete
VKVEFETHQTCKESVHTKGVSLNSENAKIIHYATMKHLTQYRYDWLTAVGTALKREKIEGTDEMRIRTLRDGEREKIVTFTATKRNPSPDRTHPKGFTVPRGYQYAEITR